MAYDALLRPTGMKSQALGSGTAAAPTGAIIHDTRPSYNAVSNITKRDTDHGSYTYGYDDLDRLTQVTPPATIPGTSASGGAASPITLPVEGYQYDAVHNRKTSLHQTGSAANAWQYNAHHQLTQWGDPTATASSSLASITTPKVTQTYDQNGHLITKTVTPQDLSGAGISKGLQSHINLYNAAERLVKVSDGSNNEIANYAYNPFGQRIKKTVSQNPGNTPGVTLGTTIYFYADEGLIAEADASGNITTSYGWNPNGTWGTAPVWKRDFISATTTASATEHYYHLDHLGTPQRLTNAAGEVTWRAVSEAFGKTTIDASVQPVSTAATVNNLRFPGQVEDEETGSRQNFFRDYVPSVGRYVQSDPIGLDGGINTFWYSFSAPLKYFDNFGLCVFMGFYPIGSGTEYKFDHSEKKVATIKIPKVYWDQVICNAEKLIPPPNPRVPRSKFPPCMPRVEFETWDLYKRTASQYSRDYEEGYDIYVCNPTHCADDGISKIWRKQLKSEWKLDFSRDTYKWELRYLPSGS